MRRYQLSLRIADASPREVCRRGRIATGAASARATTHTKAAAGKRSASQRPRPLPTITGANAPTRTILRSAPLHTTRPISVATRPSSCRCRAPKATQSAYSNRCSSVASRECPVKPGPPSRSKNAARAPATHVAGFWVARARSISSDTEMARNVSPGWDAVPCPPSATLPCTLSRTGLPTADPRSSFPHQHFTPTGVKCTTVRDSGLFRPPIPTQFMPDFEPSGDTVP